MSFEWTFFLTTDFWLSDNIFWNDFFKITSTHPETSKNGVDLSKTHLWGSPPPLKTKQNYQNPGNINKIRDYPYFGDFV